MNVNSAEKNLRNDVLLNIVENWNNLIVISSTFYSSANDYFYI